MGSIFWVWVSAAYGIRKSKQPVWWAYQRICGRRLVGKADSGIPALQLLPTTSYKRRAKSGHDEYGNPLVAEACAGGMISRPWRNGNTLPFVAKSSE